MQPATCLSLAHTNTTLTQTKRKLPVSPQWIKKQNTATQQWTQEKNKQTQQCSAKRYVMVSRQSGAACEYQLASQRSTPVMLQSVGHAAVTKKGHCPAFPNHDHDIPLLFYIGSPWQRNIIKDLNVSISPWWLSPIGTVWPPGGHIITLVIWSGRGYPWHIHHRWGFPNRGYWQIRMCCRGTLGWINARFKRISVQNPLFPCVLGFNPIG